MEFSGAVRADVALDCYQILANAVDEGVYQLDADGRFVAVDDDLLESTGYAREDLLDEPVSTVVEESDVRRIERKIHDLLGADDSTVGPFECTVGTATGERISCEVEVNLLRDDGELHGTVGIVRGLTDRTANEQAVEQYRTIVETINDGVYTVDTEGRFTWVNDAYTEMTGYSREELVGEHVSLVVDEETIEEARSREEEMVTDGVDTGALEAEILTADGDTVPAEATFALLPSDDDDYERVGIVRDVTERKQAETELRKSEERFRSMMEQSPFSVQIFDAEGRTVAANPAWERLWDAPREELDDYNILEDEQLEAAGLLPYIRDAFAGEVVTLPVTHYDPAEIGKPGRDRWIEGYAYPLLPDDGGTFEVALVHHDVTERTEREQELERYEMAVETVWDGITILDPDDRFVMVNEAFCEVTGYDREEVIGEHATLILDRSTYEQAEELHDEVVEADRDTVTMEYDLLSADGGSVPVEARFGPIEYADGRIGGAGVIRDVSERKRRERELEALIDQLEESNQRLEQFAYAASHDLQEPIRMVTSYLTLIEQRYSDAFDEEGEEFLEFAVDGAERMREMIHGLLKYSRVDTRGDPMEPVELDDVLADVRDDLQVKIDEHDAEISVGELPRVTGDRGQLRQLFQNLLDNAIEYSGDEPPRVEIDAEREADEWVLRVADDGIGMDPAHADRVFEVFERLHTNDEHPGAGIGLAVCKRIVERHDGDVRVDSAPGEGSTFTVTIPVSEREQPP